MQFMHTLFVYHEELRKAYRAIHVVYLTTNSKVNVRTHLLRKNFSSNFSSVRSGPISFQLHQIVHVWTIVTRLMNYKTKATVF